MKIAFIGMMGTGKTSVGMMLAQRLGYSFSDTDDTIVWRLGMPISQVFITFGEKVFRGYETAILRELVWNEDMVISCGGGMVLDQNNMEMLKGHKKIRLVATADEIYSRIKDDFSRPLIQDNSPASLTKIMTARENLYEKYADFTVQTDGKTIEQVTDEVQKLLSLQD